MASIIIYVSDTKYLERVVDDLIDKTPSSLIDEIIICDDNNSNIQIPNIKIISSKQIGRAKSWNLAAKEAVGSELVFLDGVTKVTVDWLEPLIEESKDSDKLVSPIVHTLDPLLWSLENNHWRRFGWRWDLDFYARNYMGKSDSPSISSYCFVVSKQRLEQIGWFDDGMTHGNGEDLELSLRNWLFGGSSIVVDESRVGSVLRSDGNINTLRNLARIVEVWMPKFTTHFYRARNIKRSDVNVGRFDNLIRLQEQFQQRSIEWFLNSQQPELFGVYDLRDTAAGKSIAIVCPGPSIDMVSPAWINRHDIVIGVDYMGCAFDCDYVMTFAAHVVVELRKQYPNEKFVLPIVLENLSAGRFDPAAEIAPGSVQFELGQPDQSFSSVDPPFCNCENPLHAAIHFALFLNPESIALYGCDNKIIGDRSHSAKIEYYNDGCVWPDSEATRRKFAYYEYNLDQIGKLALARDIPLIRVGHA